jgi:hypothetical protein
MKLSDSEVETIKLLWQNEKDAKKKVDAGTGRLILACLSVTKNPYHLLTYIASGGMLQLKTGEDNT